MAGLTSSSDPRTGGLRIGLLLAAAAAGWESRALEAVASAAPSVVLVKRCLDLGDLLGAAATGTATVAVVADGLPGLDADSLRALAASGVAVVVVAGGGSHPSSTGPSSVGPSPDRDRYLRMGAAAVLGAEEVHDVARHVRAASGAPVPGVLGATRSSSVSTAEPAGPLAALPDEGPTAGPASRLVAVWGPTGGPGRTTVAVGLAAELADRGLGTLLLDADPYGGAVAQHLAVLDDVSGLLSAARSANAGQLDAGRLTELAREVAPRLRVLTGLPRPQRWTEVRPQSFAALLDTARSLDPFVVVDTGLGLDATPVDPFDPAPGRDEMTRAALEEADDLVVVASADPVGLSRLARSLVDLTDVRPAGPSYVVVNRMRSGLGWAERDLVDMVSRVAPRADVRFLPDDRAGADRAMVSGRTLPEAGDGPLRRGLAALADAYLAGLGVDAAAPRRRARWRLIRR